MDPTEINDLIDYHRDALDQYRQLISPSAQYLEGQTIKALEELRDIKNREVQQQ